MRDLPDVRCISVVMRTKANLFLCDISAAFSVLGVSPYPPMCYCTGFKSVIYMVKKT